MVEFTMFVLEEKQLTFNSRLTINVFFTIISRARFLSITLFLSHTDYKLYLVSLPSN